MSVRHSYCRRIAYMFQNWELRIYVKCWRRYTQLMTTIARYIEITTMSFSDCAVQWLVPARIARTADNELQQQQPHLRAQRAPAAGNWRGMEDSRTVADLSLTGADERLRQRPAGVAVLIGRVELVIVLRAEGNASTRQLLAAQRNVMFCHVVLSLLRTCHPNSGYCWYVLFIFE